MTTREVRGAYDTANAQANELLYRRADIADVAEAHLLALDRAPAIGFGKYIVSATTPFSPEDLAALRDDAPAVVARLFPDFAALYAARGVADVPRHRPRLRQPARPSTRWAGGRATTSPRARQPAQRARTSAARWRARSEPRAITTRSSRKAPTRWRRAAALSPAAPPRDARRNRRSPSACGSGRSGRGHRRQKSSAGLSLASWIRPHSVHSRSHIAL